MLERYAREWIVGIEDISAFVERERANRASSALLVPAERVYPALAYSDE